MIGSRAAPLLYCAVIQLISIGYCLAGDSNQGHFNYVFEAANQINYLKNESTSPNQHAQELLDQACKMLTTLSSDELFHQIIEKKMASKLTTDEMKMFHDVAQVNQMVEEERQLLGKAGMNNITGIQALAAAVPLAKRIDPNKVNADAVLKSVDQLRDQACSLSGEIADSEAWRKKENSAWRSWRIACGCRWCCGLLYLGNCFFCDKMVV